MRRAIAALLVMSVVGPAAACSGSSGSSSTTAAPTPTVTCRTVSGTDDVGQKISLSDCSGPTGGAGTIMGPFGSPTVIHWASGGTTQLVFDSNMQRTANPTCPTQLTVMDGRVVASSDAAIAGGVRGALCIDAARTISLLPGTSLGV